VGDASVAFGWFAAVPNVEQAAGLLDAGPCTLLLAPDLVLVDLLNAAWKSLRLGAITCEQFQMLASRASEPFSRLFPSSALLARAAHWCRELDHPAYDCLYVTQAERERAKSLERQLREVKSQLSPEAARQMEERIKAAEEAAKRAEDEANAKVIRRDIRSYAKSIGFSDQELSQVYDSRAVSALYKSMMYDKLVAGKPGAHKKVQSAPKTLKPGTSNPKSSEQEAKTKDFERLRQSGNKKDAARLFERFL
jgi:predicted nucleic acid-binding protein